MQGTSLQGERLLIVEDRWLIAMELQRVLERESATVVQARNLPQALLYANDTALSAGIIDLRLGDDDAEPVCEALSRRNVPFIFFTGLSLLPQRWAATPLVQEPAVSQTIIGAVKFALSPEARDSIVKSQNSDYSSAKLARTDQLVSEAEVRIGRLRRGIVRLANSGADTSAAEQVVATTIELIEGLRTHREFSAHLASKSAR